ncbi:arylsulfatase B-like isoform X2 [Corticium candelabrum]|nr:arylsulfatase B-like isoform X2 [Corticium candelabrum]XP_062508549.1 arylsulfatase B-like isoform X2 [Corticium candelabrum]
MQHYVLQSGKREGLNLSETMLPQRLKEAGYVTHAIGKWHLGFYSWQYTPTFRGFDSFYGFYGGGEDYFTHKAGAGYDFRRDKQPMCGTGCSEVDWDAQGNYSTTLFSDEAVKIVQNHDTSKPLYLYLAYQAVHAPREVPQQYVTPYNNVIKDSERRTFAGMLACMDEGIGNLTEALKTKGMWNDTLIVFTTDNGGPIKGSRRCHICGDNTGTENYPLRGGKHSLWEGGVRGTALVHGSMLKISKYQNEGLMHATDWYPTLLTMIGVDPSLSGSKPLDGFNQWPMISQNASSAREEVLLNIDRLHNILGPFVRNGGGHAAIRRGNYKLVLGDPGPPDIWSTPVNASVLYIGHPLATTWNTTVQLFDVVNDIREEKDISADNQAVVKDLLDRLHAYNDTVVSPIFEYGGSDPQADPKKHGGAWTPWVMN